MEQRVHVTIGELVVEGMSRTNAEALQAGLAAALRREFAASPPRRGVWVASARVVLPRPESDGRATTMLPAEGVARAVRSAWS